MIVCRARHSGYLDAAFGDRMQQQAQLQEVIEGYQSSWISTPGNYAGLNR